MRYPQLNQKLDDIEAELRKLNLPISSADAGEGVTSAFGYGQISFEQWLGNVFLPSARKAVTSGEIPSQSQVGIAALRNFDGDDRMDQLVSLLCDFDQAVKRFSASAKHPIEPDKPRNWFKKHFWKN